MKTKLKVGLIIAVQSILVTAFGEIWEGTKTFGSDSTITEPVTLSGEVTVFVAAGKSVVVSGVIDGSGSLVKTGAGTLELQAQNTFAGDATLLEGFLLVRPKDNVVDSTALGLGTVIIGGQTDSYSGDCTLKLYGRKHADKDFTTTTLSIANPIHVTGNTTKDYPAVVFYYQNVVLTGKVTADQDFYFYDDFTTSGEIHSGQSDRGSCILSATFGEVEVAGTLAHDGNCAFNFAGKVTAPMVDFGSYFRPKVKWQGQTNNRSAQYHFQVENDVGTLQTGVEDGHGNTILWLEGTASFPGTLLRHVNPAGGQVFWNHRTVHVGGLENDPDANITGIKSASGTSSLHGTATFKVGSSTPTTDSTQPYVSELVIDGVPPAEGQTERTVRATRPIYYVDCLTLDAYPAFTQELALFATNTYALPNVYAVKVMSGTLKLTDGMGFGNVSNVTCGSTGQLKIAPSALEPAFSDVTTLTTGGDMRLGDGRCDFPILKSLTVSADSTLTIENVLEDSFYYLNEIHVYGTLVIDPASLPLFNAARQLDLHLHDGGRLDLRGASWEGQKSRLFINGVLQPDGLWSSKVSAAANLIATGSTFESTIGPAFVGSACTWTGKGTDTAITTAGNWENESVPNLTDGSAAVVVSGGTGISFSGSKRIASLTRSEPRVHVGTEFVLEGGSEDDVLQIDGKLDLSASPLTVRGHIASPCGVNQGYPDGNGPHVNFWDIADADVQPVGKDYSRSVTLDNAIVDKSVYYHMQASSVSTLNTTAYSTNEIRGVFRIGGNLNKWVLAEGSELVLSGGVEDERVCIQQSGSGTLRIANRPFNRKVKVKDGVVQTTGWTMETGAHLVFDVSGNDIGDASVRDYRDKKSIHLDNARNHLETAVGHAFVNGCLYSRLQEKNRALSSLHTITWDVHVTTQAIDAIEFYNPDPDSKICGGVGSLVEILQGGTNRVDVVGGMGFHMMGDGTLALAGRRDLFDEGGVAITDPDKWISADKKILGYASTGPLWVSSGRLALLADCTWRNGTDFTADGSGTLVFAASRQVDRKTAKLHLADDGKIEVPAGVMMSFAAVDVNGEKVPNGIYDASTSGLLEGRIVGGGQVCIGPSGMLISVW